MLSPCKGMNTTNIVKAFLGGGDERTRKMKRNSLSMLIVKGISILVSLAYVPMMLKYVDRTDYGVLLTLTSIVQWVALLDIGIGNGLRNSLTKNLAEQNYDKARENISSCYAALALYVSVIGIVFICVAPSLSWQAILNATNNPEDDLLTLSIITFLSFCLQFVVNLLTSILYACQMPAYTSYIMLTTQIVNFVLVYVMVHFLGMTSILEIGTITCFTPPLILILYSLIIFRKKLAHIAPTFKNVHIKSVNSILSLGVKFFILQINTLVLFQANNIIITQNVNPEAVVVYNIAYKYIGMIVVVFNIIAAPVWSATTDAYARKDYIWIKRTIVYLRKVFFCILIAGVIMAIVSPFVYRIWLGKELIDIPFLITSLVLIFCTFEILYRIYGVFINGMGKLYVQIWLTSILAILYIPLAIFLGRILGLVGVLTANIIIFFANYIWAKIQCSMLINMTATGIWNK